MYKKCARLSDIHLLCVFLLISGMSRGAAHAAEIQPLLIGISDSISAYIKPGTNENDPYVGLDAEILRGAFAMLGYEARFVAIPNKRLARFLHQPDVGAVMHYRTDPLEDRCVSNSYRYWFNGAIIGPHIKADADITSLRLVTFLGAPEQFADQVGDLGPALRRATVVARSSLAVNGLRAGRFDVYVGDIFNFIAAYRATKTPDDTMPLVVRQFEKTPHRIAFKDADLCARFNEALAVFHQSPAMMKALDHYSAYPSLQQEAYRAYGLAGNR